MRRHQKHSLLQHSWPLTVGGNEGLEPTASFMVVSVLCRVSPSVPRGLFQRYLLICEKKRTRALHCRTVCVVLGSILRPDVRTLDVLPSAVSVGLHCVLCFEILIYSVS